MIAMLISKGCWRLTALEENITLKKKKKKSNLENTLPLKTKIAT